MRERLPCPYCPGTRDYRAVCCQKCRMTKFPPRKGTGAEFRISAAGYIVRMVDNVEVYDHRQKMERKLKRKLRTDEHVHHKNGNKQDNRLSNLELVTASEHAKEHMPSERAKAMSKLGHAARWGHHAV